MPKQTLKKGDFVRFEQHTVYGRQPWDVEEVGLVVNNWGFRGGIRVLWRTREPRKNSYGGAPITTILTNHYKSDLVKAELPDLKEYE